MVQMEQVRFAYGRKPPLFERLDFNIHPGTLMGLLGRNGAGKTTLLKLAVGALFSLGGSVRFFGRPAETRHPEGLSRMAFVPEQIEVASVSLQRYLDIQSGYYPRFDRALMMDYVERFEIPAHSRFTELSYGQQKKVLLATALATGAELLILDEPTNGLDIPSKQVLRTLLAEAVRSGRSIVVSTHQVRDVENLIDTVVLLEEGRVLFEAPTATVAAGVATVRFDSDEEAMAAGALAMDSGPHGTVALVPRAPSPGAAPAADLSGQTDVPLSPGADTPPGADTSPDSAEPPDSDAFPDARPVTPIDLELLFHAAVTHPDELTRACGTGATG